MRKEAIVTLLALIAIVSIAVFANAEIIPGDLFLNPAPSYGPEQTIQGTATFALEIESGGTEVKGEITGTGGNSVSMTLKEFLDNAQASYNCQPTNCLTLYSATGAGATSKEITFSENKGFEALKATGGNVNSINLLSFNIAGSQGQETCGETPVKLDLLDDNIIDWEYSTPGSWCNSAFGDNYNSNQATEENTIDSVPYCEKITIEKTGKILINAEIKYDSGTAEEGDIVFSIYDGSTLLRQCSPQGAIENTEFTSIGCQISGENFYINEKKDFFICIKNTGSAEYSIKSEGTSPFSGFYGNPISSPTFTKDYSISVIAAGFAPFNEEVIFDSSSYLGSNLNTYIYNFISSRYNKNCNPDGCGIPIKFITTLTGQKVSTSTLLFKFTNEGGQSTSNKFYDLETRYPNLTMAETLVNLAGLNLLVPHDYGTYDFIFSIGEQTETAPIEVAQVPIIQNLIPLTATPNTETTFAVTVSSPKGNAIVSYVWDFGDGSSPVETTIAQAKHTYTTADTFNLAITARDTEDLEGSRTFVITTSVTRQGLNDSIKNKQFKLKTFLGSIETEWYADTIKTKLDTENINSTLVSLYSDLEAATETELVDIKNQLDSLDVPVSLSDSLTFDESEYIPNLEIIKPELVETLGGGTYNNDLKQEFITAIGSWLDSQDIKTSGSVKTVLFDDNTKEDVMTIEKIDISLADEQEFYLIFSLPSGTIFGDASFKENYNQEGIDDSFGIKFDASDSETIEFALPGKQPVSSSEFFISPNLDSLNVKASGETITKKMPLFWIILVIILILGGIAAAMYFIWHGKQTKVKKELFKNPMDLFNITSFIKSAQAKGMQKKEIEEKLGKAGWQKSQIAFAFKKL